MIRFLVEVFLVCLIFAAVEVIEKEENEHLKTKFELIALQASIEAKEQCPRDKLDELLLIANSIRDEDRTYYFDLRDSLAGAWLKKAE